MRRAALLLAVLVAVLGFAVAGCGGEEEATPTPETVVGTVPQPEPTETTGTETTGTETSGTETTGTETTPPAVEGDPVAGKAVFTGSSGCINCHTLADAGATGNVGPNLDQSKPSADLVVDRVTNGSPAGMPSFKGSLTDQQIADVAAYVSSVAGS
jgi:mono/diheme cytochrome c family protein